jgi:hypothetical protein
MKGAQSALRLNELLDRILAEARHSAKVFRACLVAQLHGVSNARHHPRPRSTSMRDCVKGRRVHAVGPASGKIFSVHVSEMGTIYLISFWGLADIL